jgi:hypothetical protein
MNAMKAKQLRELSDEDNVGEPIAPPRNRSFCGVKP